MSDTQYHKDTPDEVRLALETARLTRTRVRIYLGDTKTGRCWNEEHDVYGYVSRSGGITPIPILVHNSRSFGGGPILTHCIVRIATSRDKRDLYRHPQFHLPEMKIVTIDEAYPAGPPPWWENFDDYTHSVLFDGEVNANFRSRGQAERYVKHMS